MLVRASLKPVVKIHDCCQFHTLEYNCSETLKTHEREASYQGIYRARQKT